MSNDLAIYARLAAPTEHTVAIAPGLVVTFTARKQRRLAERWHPRRPAELTDEQAARYEQGAAEARRVLRTWLHS